MGTFRNWTLATGTLVWVIAVGAGFAGLWRYAATRGDDSRAPVVWPTPSRLARAPDRAALLVFVHPRCACSRATIAELGYLLQSVRGRVAPTVVFVRPRGVPADWERTGLRQLAARLPEVTIADDDGGVESHRFGASTSGATLLYDVQGRLAFSGGLTSVRGHEGDSFGQERIVALLTSGTADRNDSPVFGCALDDPRTQEKGKP